MSESFKYGFAGVVLNPTDNDGATCRRGQVIWMTGLSGAGKTTLAGMLEATLDARAIPCAVLDGDRLRAGLNRDLGFDDADRAENVRRVAEVAKLMADAGLVVIVALISPFERERTMAREIIGAARFTEVYLSTPIAVCEQRDVKGLYRKARGGLLDNFTGISSPYEIPVAPDIIIDSQSDETAAGVVEILARCLR